MAKLIRREYGRFTRRELAWFVIIDDKLYPTIEHPNGQGIEPWFRIVGDEVLPHTGNPCGQGVLPWYRREGKLIVALEAHPRFDEERDRPFRLSGSWPTVAKAKPVALPGAESPCPEVMDLFSLAAKTG